MTGRRRFGAVMGILMLVVGCSTLDGRKVYIEDSEYRMILLASSVEKQSYSGFQNVLDVKLTRLDAPVRDAIVRKKATNFQWGDSEFQKEQDSHKQKMSQGSEFFMSFYTPDRKNDNLAKADTVWRVFLDVDGKRYPGVVNKVTDSESEVLDTYPAHTRWGTPYKIQFLVPTSVAQSMSSRITITGPVGSAELDFPKLENR